MVFEENNLEYNHPNMILDVTRMSSFLVSLLLAYRVGKVYDRWWAATNAFGMAGSCVVSLVRQTLVHVPDIYLRVRSTL